MWVALVAGLLAVAGLVALVMVSRRLGESEGELEQRREDANAFERFQDEVNKPVPADEDEVRDLLGRRARSR